MRTLWFLSALGPSGLAGPLREKRETGEKQTSVTSITDEKYAATTVINFNKPREVSVKSSSYFSGTRFIIVTGV